MRDDGFPAGIGSEFSCGFDNIPHLAGDYIATVTFANGSSVSTTTTMQAPGDTRDVMTPPADITAVWNDTTNEMELTWVYPIAAYPAETKAQFRIDTFKNGQNINNRLPLRDFEVNDTFTSFTFDQKMTSMFNRSEVDQIQIEFNMKGNTDTAVKLRKTYSFDYQTGSLLPAPIAMTLLDINGDAKTGVEEAIHSLKVVTE